MLLLLLLLLLLLHYTPTATLHTAQESACSLACEGQRGHALAAREQADSSANPRMLCYPVLFLVLLQAGATAERGRDMMKRTGEATRINMMHCFVLSNRAATSC
jgi:hypothetical protein